MQKASFSLVVLAIIASGCASQPNAGTAAAVTPSPTAAASAAPEPTATPAAAPEAPAAVDPAAVLANNAGPGEAKPKVPPGYKAVQRGGETVYCKSVTPLGTRFPKQLCMTTAEYEEYERRGVGLREELTRKQISIDAQP